MSDRLFLNPEVSPYDPPLPPEFICPACGERTVGKIQDTRPRDGYRYRRRICDSCGARFTTHEIVMEDLENALSRLTRAAGIKIIRARDAEAEEEPED